MSLRIYGHPCKLYKWMAQGYHRGLIVLADDQTFSSDFQAFAQKARKITVSAQAVAWDDLILGNYEKF